jgi:type 1 glutamine amidotransferase
MSGTQTGLDHKLEHSPARNFGETMRLIDRVIRFTAVVFLAATFLAVSAVGVRGAVPEPETPRFRVVAIAEPGGIHLPFVVAAKAWLNQLAAENHVAVDYIEDTEKINDEFLSRYRLFIQLNYPPYRWTPTAQAAFIKYIEEGRGGWIGFHHAGLLGEFDGYQMWPWFSQFMGGIRYTNYIPTFVDGTMTVEDKSHPAMKGIGNSFKVLHEEFYTWDKSPRPNVHVLVSVDENSYRPDTKIKMGDHPVIWTNEHYKARNIYIFMGHHADLFENTAFTAIFTNSIFWAAHREPLP